MNGNWVSIPGGGVLTGGPMASAADAEGAAAPTARPMADAAADSTWSEGKI